MPKLKKDWRNYPENYFKIVEQFRDTGEDVILEEKWTTLSYVRHDFNRFVKSIYLAAREGDQYAANLANVTRDMFLVLEPHYGDKDTPARLIVKMHPVAKAVLIHNPPGEQP